MGLRNTPEQKIPFVKNGTTGSDETILKKTRLRNRTKEKIKDLFKWDETLYQRDILTLHQPE
jgi:hypothetical protein